jgi:hypothetical protein
MKVLTKFGILTFGGGVKTAGCLQSLRDFAVLKCLLIKRLAKFGLQIALFRLLRTQHVSKYASLYHNDTASCGRRARIDPVLLPYIFLASCFIRPWCRSN